MCKKAWEKLFNFPYFITRKKRKYVIKIHVLFIDLVSVICRWIKQFYSMQNMR